MKIKLIYQYKSPNQKHWQTVTSEEYHDMYKDSFYQVRIVKSISNKYYMKREYWKAFLIWKLSELIGFPVYTYAWWRTRCRMIKNGEIL